MLHFVEMRIPNIRNVEARRTNFFHKIHTSMFLWFKLTERKNEASRNELRSTTGYKNRQISANIRFLGPRVNHIWANNYPSVVPYICCQGKFLLPFWFPTQGALIKVVRGWVFEGAVLFVLFCWFQTGVSVQCSMSLSECAKDKTK